MFKGLSSILNYFSIVFKALVCELKLQCKCFKLDYQFDEIMQFFYNASALNCLFEVASLEGGFMLKNVRFYFKQIICVDLFTVKFIYFFIISLTRELKSTSQFGTLIQRTSL